LIKGSSGIRLKMWEDWQNNLTAINVKMAEALKDWLKFNLSDNEFKMIKIVDDYFDNDLYFPEVALLVASDEAGLKELEFAHSARYNRDDWQMQGETLAERIDDYTLQMGDDNYLFDTFLCWRKADDEGAKKLIEKLYRLASE